MGHKRRRTLGVPGRLLCLVLVPMLGAAAAVALLVEDRMSQVEATREISDEVAVLREFAALQIALSSEWPMANAVKRSHLLGMGPVELSRILGIDLLARRDQSRVDADVAIEALSNDVDPSGSISESSLRRLRTIADDPATDPRAASNGYLELITSIGLEVDARVAAVKAENDVRGTVDIWRQVDQLSRSIAAHRFGGQQMIALADVWLADDTNRPAAIRQLTERSALFERSIAVLASSDGQIGEQSRAARDSDAHKSFQGRIEHALSGGSLPRVQGVPDLTIIGEVFRDATVRQSAIEELIWRSADDVERTASARESDAWHEIEQIGLLAALGALVTAGVVVSIAASISRPLRRLVARAEAVRDGHVAKDPNPITGPSDLRLAALTFEQLVDNLRLLENKAQALSRCDLGDAVLREELPGVLGTTLQKTVNVLSDSISAREQLQQRLWHQANYDSLTSIPNRAAAIERLRMASANEMHGFAVLFIDLDDFKRINDVHGHAAGDQVLRTVATRMGDAVRAGDFVARLGGDEFMVLACDMTDAEGARLLADRLLERILQPVEVDTRHLSVGASIGIGLASPGDEPSDVLSRADVAVYQAKASSTRVHVFDATLQEQVDRRGAIEAELALALTRPDELTLHYQPIVDTDTEALHGFEALLRWHHPTRGWIAPLDFISIAEAGPLIIDVDKWVLAQATAQIADWTRRFAGARPSVSVNISARHLVHESITANIETALSTSGIDPSLLTIEITEGVLLQDLGRADCHLAAIRKLGVRVSIGDFGTKYTNISRLRELPIDAVKIDRAFVGGLPERDSQVLVQALVALAHNLGHPVIAAGVETDEQRQVLRAMGCELIQGYLISAARPSTEIEAMLGPRYDALAGYETKLA